MARRTKRGPVGRTNPKDFDATIARVHRAAERSIHADRLTATLPASRCTPEERQVAEQLANARGLRLSEHLRSRAVAPLSPEERGEDE
jgi:hypothetical protein